MGFESGKNFHPKKDHEYLQRKPLTVDQMKRPLDIRHGLMNDEERERILKTLRANMSIEAQVRSVVARDVRNGITFMGVCLKLPGQNPDTIQAIMKQFVIDRTIRKEGSKFFYWDGADVDPASWGTQRKIHRGKGLRHGMIAKEWDGN